MKTELIINWLVMRFLRISCLLFFWVLFLSSCGSVTKKYVRSEKSFAEIKNHYFSNTAKDYVYKAKIDIYGNYVGGILVIKRLAKNHHRIVFTTEFGAKMLDIELKDNELIKNKVVEQLDRKIILKTLKKDFQILLREDAKVLNTYVFNDDIIYETQGDKRYNFYFFNKENQLVKIINTSKYKEKVMITFSNISENNPQNIKINHQNIKLTIDLKSLD